MHIAALLLATAVSQTTPDAIFHDTFDAGANCPATITGSTGPLSLRTISDIVYLPGTGHVRHNVNVTQWDNIWGYISELDDFVFWPGAPGASPTIKTIGKTQYIGARFRVPDNALPTLTGTFTHVSYGGGPNVDATISRSCGDFDTIEQGCFVHDDPANDAAMLRWRLSTGNRFYCRLDPGQDYFLNIRFTNPNTTGPDCQGTTCQTTIQQFIGH
ncbi:MAG: hypothetical protein ABW186_04430 [Rhodanobacteraceae bacterium]